MWCVDLCRRATVCVFGLHLAVAVAQRSLAAIGLGWSGTPRGSAIAVAFSTLIVVIGGLALASPHAHIATDAHAAALLRHGPAQARALCQSGELLRAEDSEGVRLDLESPIKGIRWLVGRLLHHWAGIGGRFSILVLVLLGLLIQVEAQTVLSFMADRQVGEDEVACLGWAVEICHSRHGHSSEDGDLLCGLLHTAVDDGARRLEGSEDEEVGIVLEGDVVLHVICVNLVDAKLDHGRRVNRSSVRRSYGKVSMEIRRDIIIGTRSPHIWLPNHMLSRALAVE